MARTLLIALALSLTGCSHASLDVQKRAAFEFSCPESNVTVADLGSDTYGAHGCGRKLRCRDIPYVGLICDEVDKPSETAPAATP